MRSRHLLSVAVGLGLAATLVLAGGAAARAATRGQATAAASPQRYLRSLGIDPRTVVIQRGARNYAGPRCPGKGWTCTRSTRVLQLGKDANQVDCTGGTVMGQQCTIVQSGSTNSARCFERSNADVIAQDCNITQTGARNTAVIDQAVEAGGGPTQDVTQTAEVTQTASGGDNSLSVKQHVHQHVESGDTQTQDAHQELTSSQTASGSGDNASSVKQDENQDANNGSSQAQNMNASSTTPCPAASLFFVGSDPNECAYVAQTADAGDNSNSFDQSIDENAHGTGDQTQGSFEGGIKAQAELVSASGTSTDVAHQSKSQDAQGGTTQSQIDPMGCCGLSATGDDSSSETLDQSSSQDASTGTAALQELSVFGFVHTPTGGTCSVTQRASDNADSTSASASSPACEGGVGLQSSCTSGEVPELAAPAQEPLGACESMPFSPEEIG